MTAESADEQQQPRRVTVGPCGWVEESDYLYEESREAREQTRAWLREQGEEDVDTYNPLG